MAKKAKKTQEAPATGSIFDHFAAHSWGTEPAAGEKAPAESAEPTAKDLLARIDAMSGEMADLRTANQRLQNAPLMASTSQSYQVDPSRLKLDLTGLPDPVDNLTEYQTKLAERINGVIEARTYAVQADIYEQQSNQQEAERLWNGFSAKYEDWAAYPDLVGTVATQVAAEARASGVDVRRYMGINTEQFYADIAARLQKSYGKLIEEEEEEEEVKPGPTSRTQPGGVAPEEETHRTGGISGGLESGHKSSSGPAGPGDMVKDIQDLQRKSGYY